MKIVARLLTANDRSIITDHLFWRRISIMPITNISLFIWPRFWVFIHAFILIFRYRNFHYHKGLCLINSYYFLIQFILIWGAFFLGLFEKLLSINKHCICVFLFLQSFVYILIFASWQALHFAETKHQWARDDPAFLVLLSFWLLGRYLYRIMLL